jgi:hypothetical protein
MEMGSTMNAVLDGAVVLLGIVAGIALQSSSLRRESTIMLAWGTVFVCASLFEPTAHGFARRELPNPWPVVASGFVFAGLALSKKVNTPWARAIAWIASLGFFLAGIGLLSVGIRLASHLIVAIAGVAFAVLLFGAIVSSLRN